MKLSARLSTLVDTLRDLHRRIAVPSFASRTHIPATATAAPQISCHVIDIGGPSISRVIEQSPLAADAVSTLIIPEMRWVDGEHTGREMLCKGHINTRISTPSEDLGRCRGEHLI